MRYAIYFTPPPADELTRIAADWLGRDAFAGDLATSSGAIPAARREQVAEPARYGFHATLKAPFRLAEDRTEAGLLAAFNAFCAARRPLAVDLELARLDGFIALMPARPSIELSRLADDGVTAFEPFRAPLTDAEFSRRRPEMLSEGQRDNLKCWGYPHVFDDFRFHMTLTSRVDDHAAPALIEEIRARFAGFLDKPVEIAGLGLFVEPEPGAAFSVLRYANFGQP